MPEDMEIKVSEKPGKLNFGVFWISLDGRFQTLWYQTYEEAFGQYSHLKNLKIEPSLNIKIEEPKNA